jgi:hypothetical protein
MRRVFSSNQISETVLVRDALLQHGVEAIIQNEQSGMAAVPEFRPPADIWIRNDSDYDRAHRIVVKMLATIDGKSQLPPWVCGNCSEENPQAFELCWNCGHDR